MNETINQLNQLFAGKSTVEALAHVAGRYHGKVAFSTSLGAEDQVITDMLAAARVPVRIFTLDTGRMFPEIYDLLVITEKKYNLHIDVYFPEAGAVEKMVRSKGINLFYDSIENRKLCCQHRKTEPLKRALSGMEVWITGLRREQSVTRSGLRTVEWDETNRLIKVNPLMDWTNNRVWEYIHSLKLPYNPLHDKGYPSVGCQPCTRAVRSGEDIRSGRWWWEIPENKECGIHVANKKD